MAATIAVTLLAVVAIARKWKEEEVQATLAGPPLPEIPGAKINWKYRTYETQAEWWVARWRLFLLKFWEAWEVTEFAGRERFKEQVKHVGGADIMWQARHWKEITDKLVAFGIIAPIEERKPTIVLVPSGTAKRIISTAPFAPLPTKEPPRLVRVPNVTPKE